jgi:hypothetical protein
MNAIQTKIMQMYENFMSSQHPQENQPLAFNVLTRDNGTTFIQEDCVFITKDGKQFMFGVHCVASIGELLSLCANVDFLPSDFNTDMIYRSELSKYTTTPEDDEYYFPLNDFEFNIIDITSILAFPPQNEDKMIGSKEVVAGGVRYFAGQTDNGYVFKDFNAIEKKEGICYIAECAWDNTKDDFITLTPDNTFKMIDEGSVATYESAHNFVRDTLHSQFNAFATMANFDLYRKFIDKITDYILQEVDWCCFSTMLNDMDLYEELDMFLADEFVEFAKKRIKQDNDGTDIDDTLADRLFGFLGDTCYRHDDFSLTSWDDLLDKWENEPNY